MALFQGEEKNYIVEQLYILLNAGMDVRAAIASITDELTNKSLKETMTKVLKRVESGASLADAFTNTNVIPDQFLSFIRSGEASGNLKEQLHMVADQFARDKELKSKVVSASVYPLFIMVVVVLLGGANMFIILPRVTESFSQLGGKLPWFTVMMLDFGKFAAKYGLIVFPAILVTLATVIFFLFVFKKTKKYGQEILLRLPGIKDIFKQVELSRFGFVFGLLTNSGITFGEALHFLESYSTMHRYQQFYAHLTKGVENGKSFRELFVNYKKLDFIFPRSVQNLIMSAEKSGNLPKTLMQIGDIYRKKLDLSTQTLSAVIEPVLIVIVWGFVLVLALAIIYPLYSIIGNINFM